MSRSKGLRATFSLIYYRVYDTCRPTNGVTKCAEAMAAPGRRILAADESSGTIKKRFDALGAESAADNRHDYRDDEHVQRCEI